LAAFFICSAMRLLLARRHAGTTAVRHFCRHTYALAQRGVEVDGFADVHSVCADFDGWSSVMPTQAISGVVQHPLTAIQKVLYKIHI
jgi:hypothetical protein